MPASVWTVYSIRDEIPLGRNVEHDPRSLSYPVSADVLPNIQSTRHVRRIPILNQGNLGACVGFATHGVIGTNPYYDTTEGQEHRPSTNKKTATNQAVSMYSLATQLDQFKGAYPPDDTGSSGLGGAKAAQKLGLISGYQHAFSLETALQALVVSPLSVGTYWYAGMQNPDRDGIVHAQGGLLGGHQYIADEINVEKRLVGFTNSWSARWGVSGRFYMTWDEFGKLLDQDGDVTVLVPLSRPKPEPEAPATPTPDEVDKAFAESVKAWLAAKGL